MKHGPAVPEPKEKEKVLTQRRKGAEKNREWRGYRVGGRRSKNTKVTKCTKG
jgi:hypothetical protein